MNLKSGFNEEQFRTWFTRLDSSHLLFLDDVVSVRLVDLSHGARILSTHQLVHEATHQIQLAGPRGRLEATLTKLRDPHSRSSWTRVTVDFPVPREMSRTGKATGPTSPISIAVGTKRPVGQLFAGLPLSVQTSLPFEVNAQFDPDTARGKVQRIKWNEWLFQRSADLISGSGPMAIRKVASARLGMGSARR